MEKIGDFVSRTTNRLLGLIPALRRRGFGKNETVSSVLGRLEAGGSHDARVFCGLLHWFDHDHCLEAWNDTQQRGGA